jgi:hypothetical protein
MRPFGTLTTAVPLLAVLASVAETRAADLCVAMPPDLTLQRFADGRHGDLVLPPVKVGGKNDREDDDDKWAGRYGIAIYLSSRVAVIRSGGDGTPNRPFFVDLSLGFCVFIRFTFTRTLPDEDLPPAKQRHPPKDMWQ